MSITPQPGYIVDPKNPNGVIPDPNVAIGPGGNPVTAAPVNTAIGAVQQNPVAPAAAPTGTYQNEKSDVPGGQEMSYYPPGMTPDKSLAYTAPTAPAAGATSPEDAKLLALGVTHEQIKQLNTPEGLDPASFQSLIGNVEQKLKINNDLVTQRGYLMKHLYDSPLTPDELAKLPPDLQSVVSGGDKNNIELQLRLINDQIAGRAQTLSQSVKYLTDGYQTAVDSNEKLKTDATNTVLKFVDAYGSQAKTALTSLYGKDYVDKLKGMGINIDSFASTPTLAETKANKTSTSSPTDTTDATLERILGGGGKLSELTPTEQTKVENKLYSIGFYDKTPPPWFRDMKEQQGIDTAAGPGAPMDILPEVLQKLWDDYKASILGGSGSGSGLDFNSL